MKFSLSGKYPFLFVCFFLVNSVFAYGVRFEDWDGGVVFGLLFALTLSIGFLPQGKIPNNSEDPPVSEEVPWSLVILLIAGVVLTRFFSSAGFPPWPLNDEGLFAFFSLDFAHRGVRHILWGQGQTLPFTVVFFGTLFKAIPFNSTTFRLVPSILSTLAVGVGYWTAKRWFPGRSAFYFAWFLGFGFWALSFSRLFMGFDHYLILELLIFWGLAPLLFPGSGKVSLWRMAGLGLAAGLAYDTLLTGKALLAGVTLTLAYHFFFREKGTKTPFLVFLAVTGLVISPLVLAELGRGGTYYLMSQRASTLNLYYWVALFWNGFQSQPFGPAWGGCFNPITTSLAFLGLLALGSEGKRPLALWVLGLGAIFSLPGLLSNGLEIFRVLNLLPLVLGVAAYGLTALSRETPKAFRSVLIPALLVLSAGLDLYHYLGPYQTLPPYRKIWRNEAFADIFDRLQERSVKGVRTGLIDLTVQDFNDHSLDVLTRDQQVSGSAKVWDEVALVADVHYRPFLEKAFPRGRWDSFPGTFQAGDPGWTLGLIPLSSVDPVRFERWVKAYDILRSVHSERFYWEGQTSLDPLLEELFAQRELFQGDPLLESVFWEEAATILNIERKPGIALGCYRKAVRFGYPAAHLFNEMGFLETKLGDMKGARQDFQRALRAPLNRTAAEENLKKLQDP